MKLFNKKAPVLSLAELGESLTVESGTVDSSKLTVYGIFKNEIYFVRSFLSHYRSIGVEQFLIIDDNSDDGTHEYLESQPDCVILSSPYSYGQKIYSPDWKNRKLVRAGILLKSALPLRFFPQQWAIYADADEFLFLPPGIERLQDLIQWLERNNYQSVVSSLVDFYPDQLVSVTNQTPPEVVEELFRETGYFDTMPLIDLKSSSGEVRRINKGSSSRILNDYGIHDCSGLLDCLPDWLKLQISSRKDISVTTATFKTHLIRWDSGVGLLGSHRANVTPAAGLILTTAHFKFTSDLARRIAMALKYRSYSDSSGKYLMYAKLLEASTCYGCTLQGEHSKKFEGVKDFIQAGLMAVPEEL